MSDDLYPEHYRQALEIMEAPEFLKTDLFLYYYYEDVNSPYYDHTRNDSYAEDLVARVIGRHTYGYFAYLEDKKSSLKNDGRYTAVKFFKVKQPIIDAVERKLSKAIEEEKEYLAKRKPRREIRVPLIFEDKSFLLVTYSDNYADEFDVEGFKVFTTEEWEEWKDSLPKRNLSANFGTNEYNEYATKKDFLQCFEVKPITIEQAKSMFDIFGRNISKSSDWNGRNHDTVVHMTVVDYGMFPSWAPDTNEDIDDDDQDDDDDQGDDEDGDDDDYNEDDSEDDGDVYDE